MIKENILKIKERISFACSKINLDPGSITFVAVSKGRPVQEIQEAFSGGITDIGENKVQEALQKLSAVSCQLSAVKWHLVGHLQTNKVKEAVKIFDLIHSLDSLRLAEEINREAAKLNKIQEILLQVNTYGEKTKFGVTPDEAIALVKEIAGLKNIRLRGLMTIAPLVGNPEMARPYFRLLRELRDRINESRFTIHESRILSMGMSGDFEVAIEEGATMLRLGRAVFEGQECLKS